MAHGLTSGRAAELTGTAGADVVSNAVKEDTPPVPTAAAAAGVVAVRWVGRISALAVAGIDAVSPLRLPITPGGGLVAVLARSLRGTTSSRGCPLLYPPSDRLRWACRSSPLVFIPAMPLLRSLSRCCCC